MKIPTLHKWQKIEVFWIDSVHDSGWKQESNLEDAEKYLDHSTVGYFFRTSKRAMDIVQSKSTGRPEGKACIDSVMQIPLVAITSIKKL